MDPDFKVIIVGAGLSGLAMAQGLKKHGIAHVIVDKETEPRDRNWGVTISWSLPYIAKMLPDELFKRIRECQPDQALDPKASNCEGVYLRDGQTGEVMVYPHFPDIRRLNIQKTRKIWSEGLDVKYGKNCTNIETTSTGVKVIFDDGTSEEGSVLVGTDGGGSKVRQWLLGDAAEPTVLPYEFLNFSVKYTAEQAKYIDEKMHPIVDVGIHPKSMYMGLFLLTKPVLDEPETWIFYVLATWPIDPENRGYDRNGDMLAQFRERMEDWADPFKSAIAWVPDNTKVRSLDFKQWAPVDWDNHEGRVTLAGDAAHSMSFHRGQGANNALRDSERFVSAILDIKSGKKTIKEAISEYDTDVIRRGKQEVEVSRVQTVATHDHASYKNSPVAVHGIKPTIDIDQPQNKEEKS